MIRQDSLTIQRLRLDREVALHEITEYEDEKTKCKTNNDFTGAFYADMNMKYSQLNVNQIDLDIIEIQEKYPTE